MTQGRGSFTMTFDRYDPGPAVLAKKIEEATAAADKEEDE